MNACNRRCDQQSCTSCHQTGVAKPNNRASTKASGIQTDSTEKGIDRSQTEEIRKPSRLKIKFAGFSIFTGFAGRRALDGFNTRVTQPSEPQLSRYATRLREHSSRRTGITQHRNPFAFLRIIWGHELFAQVHPSGPFLTP